MSAAPEWYFATAVLGFLLLTLLLTRLRYIGACVAALATLTSWFCRSAPRRRPWSFGGWQRVAVDQGRCAGVNREKPPDFIFGQWQRALAMEKHQTADMLEQEALAIPKKGRGAPEADAAAAARSAALMRTRRLCGRRVAFVLPEDGMVRQLLDSGYRRGDA
jgi:competence protein ComEC